MNVTMREAKFVDATGRLKKFDHFFVPCRLIRYVQIPTEVDIQAAIKRKFGIFFFFISIKTLLAIFDLSPLVNTKTKWSFLCLTPITCQI